MRYLPLFALYVFTTASAQAGAFADRQRRAPRYRAAVRSVEADVKAAFKAAGAVWPPKGLYLRGFKTEDVVELWARPRRGRRLVKVREFAICARSGALGPKVRSGDLQVPEGFYYIDRFNPRSSYHLSLGLNYPNRVDRARTPAGIDPGGDIFVHGDCVTIGCLPLLDGPVEHLYVAAVAARAAGQRRIPVHLFPCRFETAACQARLAKAAKSQPNLKAFWESLRPGYELFEQRRIPPRVRATRAGYVVR